jgi:hypothetical protein
MTRINKSKRAHMLTQQIDVREVNLSNTTRHWQQRPTTNSESKNHNNSNNNHISVQPVRGFVRRQASHTELPRLTQLLAQRVLRFDVSRAAIHPV